MPKFERENRYVVLKGTDIEAFMPKPDQRYLLSLVDDANDHRIAAGKQPLKAVVIEHNWPEYEPVWSMLQARVAGTPSNFETWALSEGLNLHFDFYSGRYGYSSTYDAARGWNAAAGRLQEALKVISDVRAQWLEDNDPKDGTDVVTPYDHFLYRAAPATEGIVTQSICVANMNNNAAVELQEMGWKYNSVTETWEKPPTPENPECTTCGDLGQNPCPDCNRTYHIAKPELTSFQKVRALMGYVENGTSETVRVFQDDATGTYHVGIGNRAVFDDSLEKAIDKAYDKYAEKF